MGVLKGWVGVLWGSVGDIKGKGLEVGAGECKGEGARQGARVGAGECKLHLFPDPAFHPPPPVFLVATLEDPFL